ncbi:MAG TPA: hypothetical protein VF219_00410 [Vicinamibacterales bacterium]
MAEPLKPSDKPETPGTKPGPERPELERPDRRSTFGTDNDPDTANDGTTEVDEDIDWDEGVEDRDDEEPTERRSRR